MGAANGGYIDFAVMHVFAALQHYGAQTEFYKVQGCKESARACSNNNDSGLAVNGFIVYAFKLILGWLLVNEYPQGKIYKDGALAGVDALLECANGRNGTHIKPALP